jgi:hypothetical protein
MTIMLRSTWDASQRVEDDFPPTSKMEQKPASRAPAPAGFLLFHFARTPALPREGGGSREVISRA